MKVGRWFCVLLLVGFIVFDLCGKKAAPLPDAQSVTAAAARRSAVGSEAAMAETVTVTFDALGDFDCAWPPPDAPFVPPPIPSAIRALDGQRIVLAGYALPLENVGERTTRMLFCRYAAGCCYGGTPKPNELMEVELPDGGIVATTHEATILTGVLRIRVVTSADGLSSGLYRLEGASKVERN